MTIKQQAIKIMEQAHEMSELAEEITLEDYKENSMILKAAYESGELFEDGDVEDTPVELYSFDAYIAYHYVKLVISMEGF